MDDIQQEIIHKNASHLIHLLQKKVDNNELEISGIVIMMGGINQYQITVLTTEKEQQQDAKPI